MSIEDERLKQQFAFALEADKEKQIFRQTWLSDGERKENDAEHAWHMALMAILMAEHANEKIDILKTVTMILIHDIVEIEKGTSRNGRPRRPGGCMDCSPKIRDSI